MPINSVKIACCKVIKLKLKSGRSEFLKSLSTKKVTSNSLPEVNNSLGIYSRVFSSIQLFTPLTLGLTENNSLFTDSSLRAKETGSINFTVIELLLDNTPAEYPEMSSVN